MKLAIVALGVYLAVCNAAETSLLKKLNVVAVDSHEQAAINLHAKDFQVFLKTERRNGFPTSGP